MEQMSENDHHRNFGLASLTESIGYKQALKDGEEAIKQNISIQRTYVGKSDPQFLANEFVRLQAERRKERLTSAKTEVEHALNDVALHEPRAFELAADAIENLIRVIMGEK
jgi:hypothetical protein